MILKMLTDSFSPEEKAWIDEQAVKLIKDCYESENISNKRTQSHRQLV